MALNIDTADLEKQLKEAIIGSVIGDQIKKSIEEATRGYNLTKAIDDAVRRTVLVMVTDIVSADTEFRAKLTEAAIDHVSSQDFVDNLVRFIKVGTPY